MSKLLFIVLMSVSISAFATLDINGLDSDEVAPDFFASDPYRQCLDKAEPLDFNSKLSCVTEEYKKINPKLDLAYRHAIKTFTGERKQDLILSQELWVKHRNATCDIYQKFYDVPMYEFSTKECHLEEVKSRIQYLRELEKMLEFAEYLKKEDEMTIKVYKERGIDL